MDIISAWFLIAIAVLLICSAFFSGVETAFFSLDSIRLKKIRQTQKIKANLITSLIFEPRKLLVTILLGNELINVTATTIATAAAIKFFGEKGTGIAIGGMLFLILIFGDITPKTMAMNYPSEFALKTVYILNFIHKLFSPVRKAIQILTEFLLKPLAGKVKKPIVTEEEFQSLVEIGQAEGILEDSQREMIKNAMEFTETTVFEVMIPLDKMFCLPIDEGLDSAFKKIKENFFSRVPVYEGNLNRIKGILYTKDLLIQQYQVSPAPIIRNLIHTPYFVSGKEKVVDLLHDFQKNRIHMSIVVDNAGETAGLVCLEDLLEELFGEIAVEAKSKTRLLRKLGKNRYLISAMMHPEDFNQRFNSQLDEEEYDTLEGVLQELFGEKIVLGESRVYQGMNFTIQRIKGRRITEVIIEIPADKGKK